MNPLIQNAMTRPALLKGMGDFMDPVWTKAEAKVLSIPVWAFAMGGLVYLLWRAKPGFGLADWAKTKINSW